MRGLVGFLLMGAAVAMLIRNAGAAEPVQLAEVLASIEHHFPLIEAARREAAAADAEVTSARGAFDPLVRARLDGAPLGAYQNGRFDLLLEAPTPAWGTSFFTGYRASFGKLADYDGKLETNQYGEVRAGFSIPLLRNGPIDRRRANLTRAELGVPLAQTGVKQAQIEAVRAGSFRYWEWVAAGQRLHVAEALLTLAETRDVATQESIRRGDLARIDRVDNQRTMLNRRGAVVAATRALQAAAIELSLYLRDARGQPLLPDPSRLPAELPAPDRGSPVRTLFASPQETAALVKNRPEVERLRLQREQLRVERDWAKNQTLPAVDLLAMVSQDFGPGNDLRGQTVIEGGISLDIPTANRVARGRKQAAEAAVARVDALARMTQDRIQAEISDAHSAIEAAIQRVRLAQDEVQLARKVEEAERTRFVLGDSNILFVNLREQTTAEASLREIEARLDYHRAQTAYNAAIALDFSPRL